MRPDRQELEQIQCYAPLFCDVSRSTGSDSQNPVVWLLKLWLWIPSNCNLPLLSKCFLSLVVALLLCWTNCWIAWMSVAMVPRIHVWCLERGWIAGQVLFLHLRSRNLSSQVDDSADSLFDSVSAIICYWYGRGQKSKHFRWLLSIDVTTSRGEEVLDHPSTQTS